MKLGLVQMSMTNDLAANLEKSLKYCDLAKVCDLVFFPEIQLTPFFPQYEKQCVDDYCIDIDDIAIQKYLNGKCGCRQCRIRCLLQCVIVSVQKVRWSLQVNL